MSFFKDLKEKLIPTRSRVRLEEGRPVNTVLPVITISTDGETNSDPPTDTIVSRTARTVNDAVQTIGPVVATALAPVPVAAPLTTAIHVLVAILQGMDRYEQNTSDLAALQSRLSELSSHLCNAPSTLDPLEQMRRDTLTRVLLETSGNLTKLNKRSFRYTTRVTQAITGCSSRINEYLLGYLLASQMQMKHETHATFAVVQSIQGRMTTVSGVVTLVDAAGSEHRILVEYCTSFQQFNKMLETVFERDSIQAEVQKVFLATGEFNLCIDHGDETTQLTSDNWVSPLEAGTKVVMGLVVKQRRENAASARSHLCHFCRTRNDFFVDMQKIVSMHCKGCKRRFQFSITTPEYYQLEHRTRSARKEIKHGKIFNDYAPEAKMQLIQNFHVVHEEPPRENRFEEFEEFEFERRRRFFEVEREEMMSRFETLQSENDESGDYESGGCESTDNESGDDESGDESGDDESGDDESGDGENGDDESGDDKSGDDDSFSYYASAESWNGQEEEE